MRLADLVIPFVGDTTALGASIADTSGKIKALGADLKRAFGGAGEFLKEALEAADTDGAFAALSEELTSASDGIKAELGEILLPILLELAQAALDLTENWNNLNPAVKEGVAVFLGLIGAAGLLAPLITTLGTVIAFLATPVGLVVVVVAALIAIGWALYNNWDTIVAYLRSLWDGWMADIETSKQAFEDLKTKLKGIWESIKTSIKNAIDSIKGWISNMIPEIEIPAWLKNFLGNSPSPLELSIRGIDRAVQDLDLQANLLGRSGGDFPEPAAAVIPKSEAMDYERLGRVIAHEISLAAR